MDNKELVQNWQGKLRAECESRLGRKLEEEEKKFINMRGGFIALEMIEGTIKSITDNELVAYLNSEHGS